MTWKIKPISKSYFGKSVISLADVARKRRAGRVIIADRHNPDGSATRVFLIPEQSGVRATVGSVQMAKNLVNDRPYGGHEVLAVLDIQFKNGILQLGDIPPATLEYSDLLELTGVAFELVVTE